MTLSKSKPYLSWAGSTVPVDRTKLATGLREMRNGSGSVQRIHAGLYIAKLKLCPTLDAVIDTRSKA